MKTKKGILQELENLKNPMALNKVLTEDLKKTKENTKKEKKAIKKEFGNDSDKSAQRGNIELSPARKKAESIVFNTQEEVDRYKGSLAKQYLDDLIKPTNFNNAAIGKMKLFGIEKQYEEWEKSPYFGKSYDELTRLRSGIDGDLRRGKITRAEADKEKGVIDLWRVRTANKDELAKMLEEAKENKRLYSDMYSEANREVNNSARVATPEGIENTKKNLAMQYLSSERVKANDGIIAEIEARIADMELDKEYDNTLLEFGRIAIKSGASDEYVESKSDRYTFGADAPNTFFQGSPERTYAFINLYKTGRLDGNEIKTSRGEISNLTFLTDGEVKLYNTLYHDNPNNAENFLKKMEPILNKRLAEYQSEKAFEYGQEHPYLAGIKSVVNDFVISPIAAVDNFREGLTGDVDTYDASSRMKREAEAYRAGGRKEIELRHGEGFAKTYDAGLEIINIAANILVSKGIGTAVGALGGSTKAIKGATRIASYSNMMSRAASSTMISIADRGGSDAQILTGGIASGLIEVATEAIPFEKWLDPKATRTFLGALREGAKQYPSNFLEEALASAGNMYLDSLVMGEKSESNTRIREYMINGLSAEEATRKVMHENLTQIIEEGKMGGAIGSVVGTGTSYMAGVSRASYITREGERIIKNPKVFNKVLEVGIANNNAEANYTAEMISDGLQVNGKQAGKMLSSVVEQSIENDGGMINIMQLIGTIEGRDSSYIGSMESIDTAKAVMHMVQGKATEVDNALLQRSDGATTLLTAIEGNKKAWSKVKEAAGRELAPQSEDVDGRSRYRISYTTENEPVVVIEDDILDGVEKSNWVKTAKDAIKKFRPEIPISGRFVKVNKVTGTEYTNSKYTDHIRKTDATKYKDKLTAAGNLDEIVIASTKYVNEGLNHSRKDNFKDFARGNTLLQVGGRKYSAEVIVGLKANGDAVLYDIININDTNFDIKKKVNPNPDTSDNRVTRREDSPSTDRIPQKEESVNSYSMRDGEVYSQGKKVSIPKGVKTGSNIVLDNESSSFRKKNPKGYRAIAMMAKDLGMKVKFVKGLTDSAGNQLDGVITSEGIFINTESKHPTKWAATHEFSHRMKQTSPEAWQRYQDFVIGRLKIDGRYYAVFEAKAKAYGNNNAEYIDEEIAADYIGELFESETELADFIRESRRDAVTIRDMYYKILDKLGLLEEKKKAQLMWRDAYREAVLNVKEGKVENKSESAEKKSVSGTRKGEVDSKIVSNPYGINSSDIKAIQSIPRKSVNEFSSKEIETTEKFARKYWEEMKTKSPFFRAWYGDWREYDNSTHAIVQKSSSNKPENGRTTNKDTGKILSWNTGTVVRETINHAVKDKVSIVAVNDLKKIIEEAIYFDTFVSSPSSKTKMQNTAFMHSFYSLYKSENGIHLLKLYAEEALSNNEKNVFSRAYQLKDIEKVADIPNGVSEDGASLSDDISATTISISELFSLVKQYDKNFNPNPVNPVLLNADGTPKNLYHQTTEEIDIFETRHKGAGTTDEETPFGIFLKPTPEDIGLEGKHQMAVYAKIVNPLDVADRNELVSSLKTLSSEFSNLYDNYKNLNKEYKNKTEKAAKDFSDYITKWRVKNPDASRKAIYEDVEFNRIFEAEKKLIEEWSKNARKAELEIKDVITKTLEDNNYDGVHLLEDAGSRGRTVETWIALEPEQVKSATGNIGTFDKNNPNNKKSISGTRLSEVYDADTDQFIVNEEIAKTFKNKVDAWLRGEVESDDYFNLGNTPVVLRELGAKNLPVAYNNNVMWKMTGGKHGVAIEDIKKLPQSINNPLMVFKSSTVDNAFVVITELSDKAGDPVIVAIHLNKFQKRLKINRIASVYGKENIEKFLREEYIKGNLKYVDKIKSQQWSTNRGLQSPKLVQSITDNNIILQKEDVVNMYSMQKGENYSKKSISGTRLSEIEGSPEGESVDGTTDETNSQKFIKPGAEPRRDVKVPESVKEGTKVRQFARTAAEAETLTDETAEGVLEDVEQGKFNYIPISDKSAMKKAYASLDTMGIEWVEEKVNGAISSHSLDKHTVAMAEVLMQRYSEKGQPEKAQKLIIDFAAESTRTAQSLQAIRMLKKLDKNYEVAYIDKIVENLKEEIIEKNNKRKSGKKHPADIEVSEELKAKLMEARTEEEREAIREEIYTEIAEQLPNSWVDKWNAWRYIAMLGNLRTHVKNLGGNVFFMPMIASKNIAAKILEPIAGKVSGGKMERSKTFVLSKKYRQFAKKDTIAMRKELQGGGKHNPSDIIRDKKQVFDTKALEWMRLKVGDSLEAEDWLFLRHHYKVALSNYLAANKIDLDNMSEATLDRARRIAIKEAQRNTYRDASAFANALSKFSKKNAATALLVEGLMPFKKSPVNILKRSIEYSPAGFVKVLTTDLYKVSKGDMTASEYIDRICCSLTGTGVLALGMLFKSLGLVSGASDDDKEKEFDELMGVQNYSLTIGGHSYTLDWLVPFSLPFFVGVEMQNIIEKGEKINFRNCVEALSNITEPFFEMSMLQGLTGTVDTIKQANSSEIAGNVLWNIGTNYAGQAVPTLFGQIARTVDGTQRRSYDDKNVNVPSNIQYFVQGVMKKIPVLSQELEPYVDEWGRKNDAGNLLTNALQNMLSPGYYSGVDTSPMEKELKRLYGEVGNEDRMKIFPTAAVKKFNLSDGTEKSLTAREYTKMQTEQGQTAYKLLTDIVASKKYDKLDDFTKGKIVSKVYEIASAKGKKAVAGDMWNPNTKWISETLALMENGKYSEAESYIVEKGIEQVEDGRYETSKGSYKNEFNFDASKYSGAEIGIIERVESDWAGYNASVDMGRDYDESRYRHVKVYDEKLSDEMSIEEYAGVRAYAKKTAAMADGKESMKKTELINYLNSTDYSLAVKRALFEAIGNSDWKNPY